MNCPCEIYKSSKIADLYVYIKKGSGLECLPEPLMARMGNASLIMELELNSSRKLARADVLKVMEKLECDGFYVQMPPGEYVKSET
jgi:uncharacterized protein